MNSQSMNSENTSKGLSFLIPVLAMWIGWGIRGQLGHWTGAMIPGALLGLALSFLLKGKQFSPGLLAGLAAAGYGFGAAQTTLQTAGFLRGTNHDHVVRLGIALPGLAIKGGLWAMFAGAGVGLALAARHYHKRDIVAGLLLLIATFYAGWWVIDRPKLIYLSVDRPEIWGGLLVGGIVFLVWITVRGHTRIPLTVALYAAAAGGIGYPIAVSLAAAGMRYSHIHQDWWKLAETTFGAFMGTGIALGTLRVKDSLPAGESSAPKSAAEGRIWAAILGAALAVAGTMALSQRVLPWIILGSLLWCAAYYSHQTAWQIGVSMTFFGTAANLVDYWSREQKLGHGVELWTLAVLATLFVAWKVEGWRAETGGTGARKAFLSLLWAFVVLSYSISFINASVLFPPVGAIELAGGLSHYLAHLWRWVFIVEAGFTVAALALTWMVWSVTASQPPEPQGAD